MKTPDEIKKGLECLDKMQFFMGQRAGRELWMDKPHDVQERDIEDYNRDIENVRDCVRQLERERDAAIRDIRRVCTRCIHREHRFLADGKLDERCGTCVYNGMCNWQWRGVQEVE